MRAVLCSPLLLALALLAACDAPTSAGPDAGPPELATCAELPEPSEPVVFPIPAWGDAPVMDALCAFRAIDAQLGAARIIASGENDPGVEEAARIHGLLARYLVRFHELRVIALPTSAADALPLDRFLQTGDDAELDAYLASRDGLASTRAIESLVRELRELNVALHDDDRLHVTGFDIAVDPEATRAAVLAYVERVAPSELAMWTEALGAEDLTVAADAAQRWLGQLLARREELIAATSDLELRDALLHTQNLHDGLRFAQLALAGEGGFEADALFRAPGMLRNVRELASRPSRGPLMLIGHEELLARDFSFGRLPDGTDATSVGAHIASSELGERYFVIGQLYAGGTHLVALESSAQPFVAPDGFVERVLAGATTEPAILFSRDATFVALDQPRAKLSDGADLTAERPALASFAIADQLDAVVWLREASATAPRAAE